jgi:hypothetical protein
MVDSATQNTPDVLPQEYKDAAAKFQETIRTESLPAINGQQPSLSNVNVTLSKGLMGTDLGNVGAEDVLRINLQDPSFVDSDIATATAEMVRKRLNAIDGVRTQVVLLSPEDYLKDVGNRAADLMQQAAAAGIPSGNIDVRKSSILNPDFSQNQIKSRGIEIIESAKSTSVRLQIPTNPKHPQGAKATAEKVATHMRDHLPQIKQAIIDRIKDAATKGKSYMELTPEQEKRFLEEHEFKVDVVTQDNWTSVFIDIRSPEQVAARDKPEEHKLDDETLKKTNFFSQIPMEKRQKLVGRTILFEGEKLRKPSDIFLDVAGALDLENLVGKTMYYLKQEKPELTDKADAIMKENAFKPRDQWNVPFKDVVPDKESLRFSIDPDHADTLQFILLLPKGKAIEVAKAIATIGTQPKQETALDSQQQTAAPAAEIPAADEKLAVAAESTALGATEKVVLLDPAAIAAQEDAKRNRPPEAGAAR